MADRVTCCPHCSTSFRITEAQLQTAKGAVRCGSCLQIFRALDHLKDDQDSSAAATPEPEPEVPELDDFSDDALISDDMDQIEDTQNVTLGELSDDFLQQGSFGDNKGSLFDREIKVQEDKEDDHTDESWAVNLLDELESEDEQADTADDFLNLDEETSKPASPDTAPKKEYSRATTGSFSALSDSDIETALGEPLAARREPIFNVTGERNLTDDNIDDDATHDEAEDLNALFEEDDSTPNEHDELLQAIAPAPVEMEWHAEKSPWPRRLLWGSLSLVALLTLAGQYLWFNFDELSRKQPWRGHFTQFCPMLGCTLPSVAAPERVKAYNLVVRSHPRVDKALIIDSILLNKASFEQPFPDFVLTFSNLEGEQMAHRRFTPHEYLGGEMAGAKIMPVGQPVHISLEVVDPGPDAVNYRASIPLN